jgi:hypothetical protein
VVVEESGTRTDRGSALSPGERRGAPSPGRDDGDDALSPDIRKLILRWGGDMEQREEGSAASSRFLANGGVLSTGDKDQGV